MSNTTDLMTGSSGLPEESPAAPGLPGNVPDSAGSGGTSPESAGTVRSWPDADAHAGEALDSPKAQPTGTSRRGGAGLSAMLLPELQRLAQSMGIMGTGRMRKGQVIAAIEERQQGGGAGNKAAQRAAGGSQGAENEKSVQRGAPAGAGWASQRSLSSRAARPSSSRLTGVECGASSSVCGLSAASWAMRSIAAAK